MTGDIITPILMGIMLGGLYALIALGLSMVFGVMRLINLAHGDLVVLGSYIAYALMTYVRLDPVVSLVICIPVMFALGFGIQKYLMGRAFGISVEAPLIIAFGISLIIQNANQIMWTPLSRGLNTSYSLTSFNIGQLQFPLCYLLDFIAGIIVMVALREFLTRTYLGKAITVASQDRRAAQLMGINVKRMSNIAFGIGTALAGTAGALISPTYYIFPQVGSVFTLISLKFAHRSIWASTWLVKELDMTNEGCPVAQPRFTSLPSASR
jgi:branched-chain amino acid transport system permease protein